MWIRVRPILELSAAALVFGSPLSALGQQAPGKGAPASSEPPVTGATPTEVEVRGAPLAPTGGERDQSVAGSTVRRVELTRPGLAAADVLRTEVGATVTETGGLGASSTASIRGATAAETPVYLGGVRINDDVGGAADLSTVPLWLIERVEVYRGNAPFEADRLGIGGAIFFDPIRPHATLLALGAGAGSYGNRNAFGYVTAGDDRRALLIGVASGGAKNNYTYSPQEGPAGAAAGPDQRLQNADASLLDFWLLGQSRAGGGRVEVLVNHFERERGVVRLAGVPTYDVRERFQRDLAAITGRAPLTAHAGLELRTSALVADARLDDPRTPSEILAGLGTPGHRLDQRGERVEQEVAARVDATPSTRLRVSLSGASERLRRYEQAELPDVPAVLDARRLTVRVAGMAEHDLTRWLTVKGLAALECHQTSTGSASGCTTLEPSGRLSALAHQGGLSGFVALGRYTRPPTLGELFGTSAVIHGNPALVPEDDLTAEAGGRYALSLPGEARPLYAALTGYLRRSNELVQWVRASGNYIVPENVQRADSAGLELESGTGFARYFAAELGVTLADFRDHSPGLALANDVLPHHSRLIVAPALEAISPLLGQTVTRATFAARLLYQSNRYADAAGTEVIPEQTSLDLDASLGLLRGVVIVRARVADALAAPRYDVVGFPLPRRSVFVSAEAHLGPL